MARRKLLWIGIPVLVVVGAAALFLASGSRPDPAFDFLEQFHPEHVACTLAPGSPAPSLGLSVGGHRQAMILPAAMLGKLQASLKTRFPAGGLRLAESSGQGLGPSRVIVTSSSLECMRSPDGHEIVVIQGGFVDSLGRQIVKEPPSHDSVIVIASSPRTRIEAAIDSVMGFLHIR
ncbi:MAG TPA: hypothetical protein VHE55_13540 [Fimbriimonadaceae bacterium]|nr:hypothetical protein [Fimbriimonadaceae bacterium]